MIETLKHELERLKGQKVSYKRIAGSTLIIYFGCTPDTIKRNPDGRVLSIESPWRLEVDKKIMLGSADLLQSDEESERNTFNEKCARSDLIYDSILKHVNFNRDSYDLSLEFSTATISSFSSSASMDLWHLRKNMSTYYVALSGVTEEFYK